MNQGAPFFTRRASAGLLGTTLLFGLCGELAAQPNVPVDGIYTCTDSSGRKLRSDRPIAACLDREQTVLNPSGTVQRRVGPSLSAHQQAEQEARKKAEEAEQAQALEEKRRDRAILSRYPSRESHDKERALAHARIDTVVLEAGRRIDALKLESRKIDLELEFYQGDPNKAPPALRRQIEYVAQGLQSQQRFIQSQESERQRIDSRFDEELARLKELWQEQQRASSAVPRPGVKP